MVDGFEADHFGHYPVRAAQWVGRGVETDHRLDGRRRGTERVQGSRGESDGFANRDHFGVAKVVP